MARRARRPTMRALRRALRRYVAEQYGYIPIRGVLTRRIARLRMWGEIRRAGALGPGACWCGMDMMRERGKQKGSA